MKELQNWSILSSKAAMSMRCRCKDIPHGKREARGLALPCHQVKLVSAPLSISALLGGSKTPRSISCPEERDMMPRLHSDIPPSILLNVMVMRTWRLSYVYSTLHRSTTVTRRPKNSGRPKAAKGDVVCNNNESDQRQYSLSRHVIAISLLDIRCRDKSSLGSCIHDSYLQPQGTLPSV